MSWINLSETREHGAIAIEVPEEEPWGTAFGALAASVIPTVLTGCTAPVKEARHIIAFSARHHPVKSNAGNRERVQITGAICSFSWASADPDEICITGPVISTISRLNVNDKVDSGVYGRNRRASVHLARNS